MRINVYYTTRLGLRSMRERTEMLGGDLRVDGVLDAVPVSGKGREGAPVHDGHVDDEVRGSSRGRGSGS